MQPHFMHDLIHYKCSTCHISGVLHQRYTEIQNQDVRQKNNHTSYSANDTVNQHIFQWPFRHIITNQITNLLNQPFNPHHGIFAEYKCSFKHQIHKQEENRIPPNTVSNDSIQHFGRLRLFQMIISKCFFQCTTDETVFRICYGRLTIFIHRALYAFHHLITNTDNAFSIRQSTYKTFYIRIILQ